MNEKDRRLSEFCLANNYEGVIIRRQANISWISSGAYTYVDNSRECGIAVILWTPNRKLVITNNIETKRLASEEFDSEWDILDQPWWNPATASELTAGNYASDWPDDILMPLRSPLTIDEINCARELSADTAEVVSIIMHQVKPGWTENELAGEISGLLRKRGIFSPVLLVGSDNRIDRYRHPIATTRMIEKKALVVVCAQRYGLYVALSRMLHFGRLDDDLKKRHDAVCRIDEVMRSATLPGVPWNSILNTGIQTYKELGFEQEWEKHHQGGPIGYEPRDFIVTPNEKRQVQNNQLVAWNPSITGTKSEDTILSTTREVLTSMANWPMTLHGKPDILRRA